MKKIAALFIALFTPLLLFGCSSNSSNTPVPPTVNEIYFAGGTRTKTYYGVETGYTICFNYIHVSESNLRWNQHIFTIYEDNSSHAIPTYYNGHYIQGSTTGMDAPEWITPYSTITISVFFQNAQVFNRTVHVEFREITRHNGIDETVKVIASKDFNLEALIKFID